MDSVGDDMGDGNADRSLKPIDEIGSEPAGDSRGEGRNYDLVEMIGREGVHDRLVGIGVADPGIDDSHPEILQSKSGGAGPFGRHSPRLTLGPGGEVPYRRGGDEEHELGGRFPIGRGADGVHELAGFSRLMGNSEKSSHVHLGPIPSPSRPNGRLSRVEESRFYGLPLHDDARIQSSGPRSGLSFDVPESRQLGKSMNGSNVGRVS